MTIDDTIARVRSLDKTATPGPWELRTFAGHTFARSIVLPALHSDEGETLVAKCESDEDAALIIALRTDALALAAEVERLRALVDVPYRLGLPSVEQVQAHEARGGCWMRRRGDGMPRAAALRAIQCRDESWQVVWHPNTTAPTDGWIYPSAYEGAQEWRPCLPDGTQCPWPEVPHGG